MGTLAVLLFYCIAVAQLMALIDEAGPRVRTRPACRIEPSLQLQPQLGLWRRTTISLNGCTHFTRRLQGIRSTGKRSSTQ
ncbi:Protein of unknown function [Gryllus bimaculatus]|nr:Protein of unknown function [Gryllus bimaculatus]